MTAIDHARCSELLPAFLKGELGEADAAAVRDHLSGCDECRSERTGLEALLAAGGDALTTEEQTRLERGVMSAIAPADVIPMPARRSFGARAAQLLGAAAAITLIGGFIYLGVTGGGSGGGEAGVAQDALDAADAPEPAAEGAGGGGGDRMSRGKEEQGTTDTAAGSLADDDAGFRPPMFAATRDSYTSAELERLGESSDPSVMSANYYNAGDADRDASLLEQLVDSARSNAGNEIAAQVEECSQRVLDSQDSIVPTFGILGELDGTEAVIVGFAWTSRSSGSLDQYMVWAWERGDCDVTLEYISGRIRA